MQYHLDKNKNLVITADDEDKRILLEFKKEEGRRNFFRDKAMYELLEPLTCNSELEWSDASSINSLTDAPVLAVFDSEEIEVEPPCEENNYRCIGYKVTSGVNGVIYGSKILQAWAYMDYAVRSPQQDLLDYGKAVFTLGWDIEEDNDQN